MEKITIKDLATYLPYKLRGFNHLNKIVEFTLSDASYHLDKGFKPFLRPPSDLTKEIEHDGEKFVPIQRLYQLFKVNPNWIKWEQIINGDFKEFQYLPHCTVEKLHEWHFGTDNLIKINLAIDINTIEQKN